MRRARRLALALLLHECNAISVEGGHTHSPDDIDQDDYLWEKLPGRCCFLIQEECPYEAAPRELCTKTSASTCGECNVWSEPDNFCHTSKEACSTCSMMLYCPAPPPLVAGNKVCTGESRVGQGCFDELVTGVCASHSMSDCQDACRKNSNCDVFVFYQEEAKGSCVLCADLMNWEPTPHAATRAYVITPAAPPPTPLAEMLGKNYHLVTEEPPPSPPRDPPRPASDGDVDPSMLGRQHKTKELECEFHEGIEYTVSENQGYADRTASSMDECCRQCGDRAGCKDFVFEPSTGTCVLLPEVEFSQIEQRTNLFVVSGSVKISAVKRVVDVASCKFMPGSAYAGAILGPGLPVPGGQMNTKTDCCESCGRAVECTKFTFDEESHSCTLHGPYADMYMVNDKTTGTIDGKGVSFNGVSQRNAFPPPPSMPGFATLHSSPPPPPLQASDSGRAQEAIAYLSVAVIVLLIVMFSLCFFFFFSPQLRAAMNALTGKSVKYGKPVEQMGKSRGKRGKKRADKGARKIIVQTSSMTQSKNMPVGSCKSADELVMRIFDEFSHMVKALRPAQTVLLCKNLEASAHSDHDSDDDEGDEEEIAGAEVWQLVDDETDFAKALASCKIFKLVEERRGVARAKYSVAFPKSQSFPRGESTMLQLTDKSQRRKEEEEPMVRGGGGRKERKDKKERKRDRRKKRGGGAGASDDDDSDGRSSVCSRATTSSKFLLKERPEWECGETGPTMPTRMDDPQPPAARPKGWHEEEPSRRMRNEAFVPDSDML